MLPDEPEIKKQVDAIVKVCEVDTDTLGCVLKLVESLEHSMPRRSQSFFREIENRARVLLGLPEVP